MGVATCIRCMMVLLNALLALIGAVIIGIGSYLITMEVWRKTNWGTYFLLIVIAVGLAIFFTASCGCAGALKKSYCLLVTHTVSMFLLTTLSAFAVGIIFLYKNKFARYLAPILHEHNLGGCNDYYSTAECEGYIQAKIAFVGLIVLGVTLFKVLMVVIGGVVSHHVRKGKQTFA